MSLQSRACFACYMLASVFTAYSARLVWLAVADHEELAARAENAYRDKISLPAQRGAITDVNGELLATNEPLKDVIVDGSLIKERDRAKIANILAGPCAMTTEELSKKIATERKFVVVKKKITEEKASAITTAMEAAKLKGVFFQQNFERIYPVGEMLCHVVGFYGFNGSQNKTSGIEGVERSMDDWLVGQDGWRYFQKDGKGRELVNHRGEERAPQNGARVRLTVDLKLQQIVESELNEACGKLHPKRASVIMMDPKTGAILAMANRPNFDPNEPGKAKPEQRFNHAVAGIYEPGSTFKTVTVAGAVNYHLVTMNTEIFCENGQFHYGGGVLRDHHPYGSITVSDIIAKSSNIGAAKLGIQLGDQRFYNWLRNFGFGSRTGIPLPGESVGILRPPHQWSKVSITHIPMGHEVAATPLQVITATCAIANGGHLMMPQLIRDITDEHGAVLADYQPQEVRQVTTEATASAVRDALIRVTSKSGTAFKACVPGYEVAGKTGTAQKIDETGHYSHEDYLVSFVGFMPAKDPKFCCIVIFDEAQLPPNENVGGLVAAPVFSKIAGRAASHLGLRPDPKLMEEGEVKNLAQR